MQCAARCVIYHGFTSLMRFIGMCRRLLSRIGLPVGRSLRLLLWDEFPEGRQYTDVMSGNVAANLAAQVDSLRHEKARAGRAGWVLVAID